MSWVSDQHRVSMEPRRCLSMNTHYIPGYVVDRGSDTLFEFFVVHSPNIGQIGPGYEGRLALFLIFLSNTPCV
jgi:deoxycytidine triphosphate deaminase